MCQVSATNICITVGRLTPVYYDQLISTVNVSYALYHYGPFLVELEECSFVRQTLKEISKNDCPGLKHHSRRIVVWLAMASAALMISSTFWVHHSAQKRKQSYNGQYASTISESAQDPPVGVRNME